MGKIITLESPEKQKGKIEKRLMLSNAYSHFFFNYVSMSANAMSERLHKVSETGRLFLEGYGLMLSQ